MAIVSKVLHISDLQMILIGIILTIIVFKYISLLWRQRNMIIKSWNHPGPLNLPVIGYAYRSIFVSQRDMINYILEIQARYPNGFKIWFLNRLIYFIHEPQEVEKILRNPKLVTKDKSYRHVSAAVGNGLLTSEPQVWKKHRRLIMPSFNQKVLDSYVEIFSEQSLILNEILDETVGTAAAPEMFKILSRCILDIVCETTMGLKLSIQKDNTNYGDVFNSIMKLVFTRIVWDHPDFVWKITGHAKKLESYVKIFKDLSNRIIETKLDEHRRKKDMPEDMNNTVDGRQKPFLDYIVESGELSPSEIVDEINIILFAGTDTTASTMQFIFATLGILPDIQQKVYEEVANVLGQARSPNYKDLQNLVYTERVIKECLRLFPAGTLFSRTITENVDMGHYVIPEGAIAVICPFYYHRNPKWWIDPLKFDPDRFLPEEVAKRHPCTYIPFSYGPRNCIGSKYAMMNMKVMLCTVIRKFNFHCKYDSIEKIKVRSDIVMKPIEDGITWLSRRTEEI